MTFFTQLVYKLSQIPELKYKRIFLANFFKTSFFYNLTTKNYKLSQIDFDYICYIYKLMPESILYSLNKIKQISGFNKERFRDFVYARLRSTLQTEKFEEQVYFYYAIKECGYEEQLSDVKELVLNSKNQILISYFLTDKIIEKDEYKRFLTNCKESEWLQNYHYLLTYDKANVEILIPKQAKDKSSSDSYLEFYKENLDNNISILRSIDQVAIAINEYIETKIRSYSKLR